MFNSNAEYFFQLQFSTYNWELFLAHFYENLNVSISILFLFFLNLGSVDLVYLIDVSSVEGRRDLVKS